MRVLEHQACQLPLHHARCQRSVLLHSLCVEEDLCNACLWEQHLLHWTLEEMSRTHFLCLLQASEHKENCPQTCTAALSCIQLWHQPDLVPAQCRSLSARSTA